MFYTYAHYTPQGNLFYIGKGQGRRANAEVSRNRHWRSVVNKYGKPEVQILAHWKTQEEAFDHEKLLISCFRDMGFKLCNITNGGEGTAGIKLSDVHKKKISAALKGRAGKKPPPETIEKLRMSHIGQRGWKTGLSGKLPKHTEETKAKISASCKARVFDIKYCYIGVNQITSETIQLRGNLEIKKAGFDPSKLRECSIGIRKSHKNFVWHRIIVGDKK